MPVGAGTAVHTSSMWARHASESELLRGALRGCALAAAGGLSAVCIFVRNLQVALLVLLTTAVQTAMVLGTLAAAGCGLGAVEALVLPIMVGASVQHTVTLAHAYQNSVLRSTHGRTKSALIMRGGSVCNTALFAAVCALALLASEVAAVAAVGRAVVLIGASSGLCALVLFPALLMQFGPRSRKRLLDGGNDESKTCR